MDDASACACACSCGRVLDGAKPRDVLFEDLLIAERRPDHLQKPGVQWSFCFRKTVELEELAPDGLDQMPPLKQSEMPIEDDGRNSERPHNVAVADLALLKQAQGSKP